MITKRNTGKIIFFLILFLYGASNVHARTETEAVTQISTIDALLTGIYDGETTIGQLKKYGNFGIGTFNALDGEMVAVNGNFYQVKSDGLADKAEHFMKTPFATVTFFDKDEELKLRPGINFNTFERVMDNVVPTKNIFYALQIKGRFREIKLRSVPKQRKPYAPLSSIIKKQPLFYSKNIEGVIVGFRCPPFVEGINVPGYHFHFISNDTKMGGHVLDFTVEDAMLQIDYTPKFIMLLPGNEEFYKADLTINREEEFKKVEK
ncbi:MAG: acetolactate decarboxylase [Candidatus Kuenenia sp.]|nr:acetolactate decarboxylase [Candidatus Kuenenia hertensis]